MLTDSRGSIRIDGASATGLPTLLKLENGYRIYDPGVLVNGRVLRDTGEIDPKNASARGFLMALTVVAIGIGLPVLLSGGAFWLVVMWLAIGLVGGFLLVAITAAVVDKDLAREYRKANNGADPYLTIGEHDRRSRRICDLAADITATTSWRQGVIDPDRRLSSAIWSAVQRDARFSAFETRLREDTERGVSETILEPLRNDLVSLDSDLKQVEVNLSEILRTAHSFDAKITSGSSAPGKSSSPKSSDDDIDHSESIVAHSRALRDLI